MSFQELGSFFFCFGGECACKIQELDHVFFTSRALSFLFLEVNVHACMHAFGQWTHLCKHHSQRATFAGDETTARIMQFFTNKRE